MASSHPGTIHGGGIASNSQKLNSGPGLPAYSRKFWICGRFWKIKFETNAATPGGMIWTPTRSTQQAGCGHRILQTTELSLDATLVSRRRRRCQGPARR